jgi:hypothetical protein
MTIVLPRQARDKHRESTQKKSGNLTNAAQAAGWAEIYAKLDAAPTVPSPWCEQLRRMPFLGAIL